MHTTTEGGHERGGAGTEVLSSTERGSRRGALRQTKMEAVTLMV